MHQSTSHTTDFGNSAPAALLINKLAGSRVLLVCEHASNRIPEEYADLGLSKTDKASHAAWDLGALDISKKLSKLLDATLVISTVSRLVYDCNRPPSSPDAMRPKSEQIVVPGNRALTPSDKTSRVETVYEPFKDLLSDTITSYSHKPILVTIHSFTREYYDQTRDQDIGLIYDQDSQLSLAMMKHSQSFEDYKFALNEPYSKEDGVTYTLKLHGTDNGINNVMIEVCNDLLETEDQQNKISMVLAHLIRASLADMRQDISLEPRG